LINFFDVPLIVAQGRLCEDCKKVTFKNIDIDECVQMFDK